MMEDRIPLKECIKGSIAEMGPLITNDGPRHPMFSKIFALKNLTITLDSFILIGMASIQYDT